LKEFQERLNQTEISQYHNDFDEQKYISSETLRVVCRATSEKSGNLFAIKKIPLSDNQIESVKREIEKLAKLHSYYVVQLFYSWIEDNYYLPDYKRLNFQNDIYSNLKIYLVSCKCI
jgi:serine/threonine protein kinase